MNKVPQLLLHHSASLLFATSIDFYAVSGASIGASLGFTPMLLKIPFSCLGLLKKQGYGGERLPLSYTISYS
jgi:hypothetical protein